MVGENSAEDEDDFAAYIPSFVSQIIMLFLNDSVDLVVRCHDMSLLPGSLILLLRK